MHKNKFFPILILLLSSALAGCVGSPTFMQPDSMVSGSEAQLYNIVLYMALAVFLLVIGVLLYNVVRFRSRSDDLQEPRQIYGNSKLEIIWTAVPILLVGTLFFLTIRTISAIAAPRALANDVNVTVVGHQWWWEFDYPDQGFITANELHVPVGANVHLDITSADVIHSFWVPQLSHKVDAIPGQTNQLWFNADTAGDFHGHCAEFCGANHANMRIKVVVESQADYDAWVQNQQQPAYQPQTDQEQQAYTLVTQGVCSTCHTLDNNYSATRTGVIKNSQLEAGRSGSDHPQGTNANGTINSVGGPSVYDPDAPPGYSVGPNLTHLMSRSTFAGATYDLTEANLRNWLHADDEMKPGNDMKVNLSQDQIDTLMSYLTKLK